MTSQLLCLSRVRVEFLILILVSCNPILYKINCFGCFDKFIHLCSFFSQLSKDLVLKRFELDTSNFHVITMVDSRNLGLLTSFVVN